MLMITITIASLVALSIVAYKSYVNKEKALDLKAKYNSIKDYVDDASRRILTLEDDKANLAATIITLKSNIQSVTDQLTAEKRKSANAVRPIKLEKTKAPVATMKAEAAKSDNTPRRGRPNKANKA